MGSWFGWKKGGDKGGKKQVLDGREIEELVENKEAFATFVHHKFEELDHDHDGRLSVQELQPAVADIGAALGLPAQGASAESDHIYSEVLNEFTHGEQKDVSKSEFQEVLSDILLGMAAGLKRDPIVILRIDGKDLKEFIESQRFEPEVVSIFSRFESANASLRHCIISGLEQLTVEQGMPPTSDSWVRSNFVEPVLQSISIDNLEQPASQEIFLEEFKKILEGIVHLLREKPVIVAHSENTFDGSGVKRLLSNKFEVDKFDAIVNEAVKTVTDDGKPVHEEEFKKMLIEILGVIMLQLEGSPIFVSSNSVVHEPLASSSTLLVPLTISAV